MNDQLAKVHKVVDESGLWKIGSPQTHGFVLSPEFYKLHFTDAFELEDLAAAIHDCLKGLSRIAWITSHYNVATSSTWKHVRSVFQAGVSRQYKDIALTYADAIPAICKVDILEDQSGKFRVVEVDANNKHGMGYAILGARMRKVLAHPGYRTFRGIPDAIVKALDKRGQKDLVLVWGDQEKFYIPEFHVFADEMKQHGINVILVGELDLRAQKGVQSYAYFVDIPVLDRNYALRELLVETYQSGIPFLIPPKPYLGSKSALALLANPTEDPEIEFILRSQISETALKKLREHLPTTYLVNSRGDVDWDSILKEGRYVLKAGVSSGMKGVFFSDSPGFQEAFDKAKGSSNSYVLQREIDNLGEYRTFFNPDGTIGSGTYFKRLTMHIAQRSIAEITVTARTDRRVHGAPDCLQMGTVVYVDYAPWFDEVDPKEPKTAKKLESYKSRDQIHDLEGDRPFEAKMAYLARERAAGMHFEDIDARLSGIPRE